MKTYIVTVPVTAASGVREYRVFAASAKSALKKVARGDAVCVSEQLEADELDFESAATEEVKS
ncbi:MAG: hypothetical protein Q7R45_15625 [Sulfuricaulis sp.]|nr:hypothetical protein [Sulfuricaulis sp.]